MRTYSRYLYFSGVSMQSIVGLMGAGVSSKIDQNPDIPIIESETGREYQGVQPALKNRNNGVDVSKIRAP